ncbi:hypothetical protein RUMCAL_02388 [Ruminococcus callidus ATCC 27760]|uniref:Uncharacterized protein n=1 Tax=Ruminococcus callidus ATCC 27760 TaxID=411473 RepID=U2LSP4_9FIRM|nr:hypothetical protein RUMCAL_02388 [Ruminococcus callidus ATCC 27760]
MYVSCRCFNNKLFRHGVIPPINANRQCTGFSEPVQYLFICEHDFVDDKEKIHRHTVVRQGFLTQSATKSAEKTCGKKY